MSDSARERSRALAAKYRSEMALDELREAHAMTQVHLAKILGVNQAAVSKLERRTDMYVSTLQDFVKAMGGELKIIARFPEGTVEINQLRPSGRRRLPRSEAGMYVDSDRQRLAIGSTDSHPSKIAKGLP